MKAILKYSVAPTIPESITKLNELAYNFWWSWNSDAKDLFAEIDNEKWVDTNNNPVLLIKQLSQERLQQISEDEAFTTRLNHVYDRFKKYLSSGQRPEALKKTKGNVAYFCAEFGLSECFQNYSGGLGVLAGDHLKTASDLDLPLVAIGLLYQQGYFHQYLSQNGWQTERYIEYDYSTLALELMKDDKGEPLLVSVELPKANVWAQIWRVNVGRISLYLLDTNIASNDAMPEYRDITDQLYGGTTETRIMQEMLLGIGGMRALRALNIDVGAIHINEGHAAFSSLEHIRQHMVDFQLDFNTALELTRVGSCFTTHTPVPAGNEVFTTDLMRKYFSKYYPTLGLTESQFLALGQQNDNTEDDGFSMTVLGLRHSTYRNGVSALHGAVARKMWRHLWPHVPAEEVPIRGITNGIHSMSWVAKEFAEMYDKYLPASWRDALGVDETWKAVETIPDDELWQTHEQRRSMLVDYVRSHLKRKENQHITTEVLEHINECLHPRVFTIGFARRFATYKRSALLFSNMDRLARILLNPDRPAQIVITGKAHPRDTAGKETMQHIVSKIKHYGLEKHIVFLEDYDMGVAKFLVKGSDIWLNTPRRPYEASGTSGMKAAINGVLHCSILDGWWAEAYTGDNGFAIGRGEDYLNADEQDMVETEILYSLLENTILPQFYERNEAGVPHRWVRRMKNSIRTNAGMFSTERMLKDYVQQFYVPALEANELITKDKGKAAKALREWKLKTISSWPGVKIQSVALDGSADIHVGKHMKVRTQVEVDGISPDDLRVQLYYGSLDSHDNIVDPRIVDLDVDSKKGSVLKCSGSYICEGSGMQGATVRVVAKHPLMASSSDLPCYTWAEQAKADSGTIS